MKPSCLLLVSVFSLWTSAASYAQEETPEAPLPSYFDQKEPGLVPQRFAPGAVSVVGRYESALIFSPDLQEMYYSAMADGVSQIYVARWQDGQRGNPVVANFTEGKVKEEFGTGMSDSGHLLFFTTQSDDYPFKIWSARRTDEG